MPGPKRYSRFTRKNLTERQLKSFTAMYKDMSYSTSDIAKRFGLNNLTITELARSLGLEIRKPGR